MKFFGKKSQPLLLKKYAHVAIESEASSSNNSCWQYKKMIIIILTIILCIFFFSYRQFKVLKIPTQKYPSSVLCQYVVQAHRSGHQPACISGCVKTCWLTWIQIRVFLATPYARIFVLWIAGKWDVLCSIVSPCTQQQSWNTFTLHISPLLSLLSDHLETFCL